jgi:hypothetical protein
MAVKLLSSSSGSVTLDVPVTASNFALTLPAANGTVITTGSTGQVIPKAALPTGSVLQVVNTYNGNSSDITTTSLTFVASGISASITPIFATSRIFIQFSASMTDPNNTAVIMAMFLNGSMMAGTNDYSIGYRSTSVRYAPSIYQGFFQPSNTSTLTFAPYIRSENGSSTRFVHSASSYCLTLMEIAA